MYTIIWGILTILFIIIEATTINLVTIWFALGSLITLLFSFLTDSIIIQLFIFIISTSISLIFTKPLTNKILVKTKTNSDAIIDKKCLVIEDISNLENTGRIEINGITWKAKSLNNEIIKKETIVQIKKIEGVTVFVELI
jgi:membrane protein implicated in regulation of membrane protease activity